MLYKLLISLVLIGMDQLENRAKEKQLQMEQVMQENRLLLYQQRLLAKQIEELQGSKVDR